MQIWNCTTHLLRCRTCSLQCFMQLNFLSFRIQRKLKLLLKSLSRVRWRLRCLWELLRRKHLPPMYDSFQCSREQDTILEQCKEHCTWTRSRRIPWSLHASGKCNCFFGCSVAFLLLIALMAFRMHFNILCVCSVTCYSVTCCCCTKSEIVLCPLCH